MLRACFESLIDGSVLVDILLDIIWLGWVWFGFMTYQLLWAI